MSVSVAPADDPFSTFWQAPPVNDALGTIVRSEFGVRAQLALPLARLGAMREPATRPLRRALATTLAGRLTAAEREWVDRIEARRGALGSHDEATDGPFDPGTVGREGGLSGGSGTTVAGAATMMSLSRPWCTLLMRLVRELGPASCLELGSGFGISGAYQAAALDMNGSGKLTTMEGSESIAAHARETLDSLGLGATGMTVGPIGETLPAQVERSKPIDFAFVDAEHQAAATLEHFRTMVPALATGGVLVFDDVNWDEMRPAFDEISSHERVAVSVPAGRLGLILIR
jgi:predicted O-methyltransferase YrrM